MITAEVSTEFWILFSIPSPFLTLLQLSYISLHPVFSYLSSNFIYCDEHLKFYLSIMFFRSPCLNTLTIFMISKHFFFFYFPSAHFYFSAFCDFPSIFHFFRLSKTFLRMFNIYWFRNAYFLFCSLFVICPTFFNLF